MREDGARLRAVVDVALELNTYRFQSCDLRRCSVFGVHFLYCLTLNCSEAQWGFVVSCPVLRTYLSCSHRYPCEQDDRTGDWLSQRSRRAWRSRGLQWQDGACPSCWERRLLTARPNLFFRGPHSPPPQCPGFSGSSSWPGGRRHHHRRAWLTGVHVLLLTLEQPRVKMPTLPLKPVPKNLKA